VGGLRVCVQHSGGLETCYYHASAVYVTPGQTVARGQLIAAIGLTGVTTGPHVHWELKVNGVLQNPLAY
jgi:lysostaphin